jgi:hypothetical protein
MFWGSLRWSEARQYYNPCKKGFTGYDKGYYKFWLDRTGRKSAGKKRLSALTFTAMGE